MDNTDSYQVPALKRGQYHQTELVIKKSRFIATTAHTEGMEEAKAFIAQISKQYADARHNCFAFNAYKAGSTAYCGCSDDGEPHGTAGQPMLNVILHCGVGEITCVVTRYFGGILLGTGGLVKAYQDSVKENLKTLPVKQKVIEEKFAVVLDHRHIIFLMRLTARLEAQIAESSFDEKARYEILVPQGQVQTFIRELQEQTCGVLECRKLD